MKDGSYTSVVRVVHLDLVPNLCATTFISFKRFAAKRSFNSKVISDNSKTFKSAARHIEKILKDPDTLQNLVVDYCVCGLWFCTFILGLLELV